MRQVFFRSLIDKSDIGSNSWYKIEFDIPLPPWDGTKTLILEFSHMCDNEYFDIGAIVESKLYYDSVGNVFSNEVGRTQYMIIKHDKCGNYPYAGLYYVNMDSRINTFSLPQAYPGATQVLVTISFSHTGRAVCCVAIDFATSDTRCENSKCTCFKEGNQLADLKRLDVTNTFLSPGVLALGGEKVSIRIGSNSNPLISNKQYTAYCVQEQSHTVSSISFNTPVANAILSATRVIHKTATTVTVTTIFSTTASARCLVVASGTTIANSASVMTSSSASIALTAPGGEPYIVTLGGLSKGPCTTHTVLKAR